MRMWHLACPADLCLEGLRAGYRSASLHGDKLVFPRNYENSAVRFHCVAQLCRETHTRLEDADELLYLMLPSLCLSCPHSFSRPDRPTYRQTYSSTPDVRIGEWKQNSTWWAALSHCRTMRSKKAPESDLSFFHDSDGCWGALIHVTHSQFHHVNLFHVPRFHSKLSKWVNRTHYFVTQRVCLLLLVFISINFVSAGLTRITTSMSCTFDLKIKLIWEVFKALLIFIRPSAVAMRLASFFLKLEILLPIRSLGCSSPNSDHIIFNIFLRAQSRISQKVIGTLVLVFPPFILPILLSESESHNTSLSLTFFINPEAALSPTEGYGCRVTTKHYSSPSVLPPSSLNLGWAREKVLLYSNLILKHWWRGYSSTERIQKIWSIPNVAYPSVLTHLSVPHLQNKKPTKQTKPILLAFQGNNRKLSRRCDHLLAVTSPDQVLTIGQRKIIGLCWEKEALRKSQHCSSFIRVWSYTAAVLLHSYPNSSTS